MEEVVQFSHSVVSDPATPWTAARQASLSITSSRSLLKFMSIESVMHPVISSSVVPFCLQFFPASESFPMSRSLHQVAKVLEIQLQHQSFQWIFRTDFLYDWLVEFPRCPRDSQVSSPTPQFKSINSLVLNFFMVQLSCSYMTAGKIITLTKQTFFSKVTSLLNMLSRLIIAFLPRSKHLLISWLQSPSSVILEPKKTNSHYFHCFPIYLPWSHGTRCRDLSFLNVEF